MVQCKKNIFHLETPALCLHSCEVRHGWPSVDLILTLQLLVSLSLPSCSYLCDCHFLSSSVPLGSTVLCPSVSSLKKPLIEQPWQPDPGGRLVTTHSDFPLCGHCTLCNACSEVCGKPWWPDSLKEIHHWPWEVSVRIENEHVCGGALIDFTWVISAAHCIQG